MRKVLLISLVSVLAGVVGYFVVGPRLFSEGTVATFEVVDWDTGAPLACAQLEASEETTAGDFTGPRHVFDADSKGVIRAELETGNYAVSFSCTTGGYPVLVDGASLKVSPGKAELTPGTPDYYEGVGNRIRVRLLPRSHWGEPPSCPREKGCV